MVEGLDPFELHGMSLRHRAGLRGAQGAGDETTISVNAYDEMTMRVPLPEIVKNTRNGAGIVCLVGVQSNQFPRALDIAKQLRDQNVTVILGGFHVSGCLSMLKDIAIGSSRGGGHRRGSCSQARRKSISKVC